MASEMISPSVSIVESGYEVKAKRSPPKGKWAWLTDGTDNVWLRLFVYCLACLMTSCIYFGWQDYSKMLLKSGAYTWKCDPFDELDESGHCDAQKKAVTRLYSFANGSEFVCAAIAGLLLDWIGPRYTAFMGEFLQLCATLMLSLSSEKVQMYIPALLVTGACVNIICFPALTVMENWPKHQALLISLIVGAQSAASVVAPVMSSIWKAHPEWSYRGLWGAWLGATWFPVTLLYLWMLPRRRNFKALLVAVDKTPEEGEEGEEAKTTYEEEIEGAIVAVKQDEASESAETRHSLGKNSSDVRQPQTAKELWKAFFRDLMTFDLLIMAIYFALQMFQFAYYPAVVEDAVSSTISDFVGWMTPLQGPFSVVIGFIMDYTGTILVMYGMCGTLVFVSLTVAFGARSNGLMRFVAVWFVFMQSATYNVKYTFVNEMYDPFNFGKLVGFVGICGGVGVYISAPMTASHNYKLIFSLLTGLAVIMAIFTTILFIRQRRGKNYKTIAGVTQTARVTNKQSQEEALTPTRELSVARSEV